MSDRDLRARGFRRIPSTLPQVKELAGIAADMFDYEVLSVGSSVWLRLRDRQRGTVQIPAIHLGPTIRKDDIHRADTYDFLRYRDTKYAEGQGGVRYSRESLEKGVQKAVEDPEPLRRFYGLTHALAFSSPILLRSVLEDMVLPAFFGLVPDGLVQVIGLNDVLERRFGFLRAAYALSHYPVAALDRSRGFAALTRWDAAVPIDYLEATLSVLQAATYPYMPMFHGGPFGLSFVFLLPAPIEIELPVFPRTWLHWTRSGSEFGLEERDSVKAIQEPNSELGRRVAHRRYLSPGPLPVEVFHEVLLWAVGRLDVLLRELPDPANFEQEGDIDFVFALEHNLSMTRLFRRAIHILGSEEPPSAKFTLFEMADLLDGLAVAFGRTGTPLFKELFNPIQGRRLCEQGLNALPSASRSFFQGLADRVYGDLETAVKESIWIKDKINDGQIRVRSRDLSTEKEEDLGSFAGALVRALRNTLHGYLSRLDRSNRPSRYLAMTTGNLPDSISALALPWILCLLADTKIITGWKPLGFGIYD